MEDLLRTIIAAPTITGAHEANRKLLHFMMGYLKTRGMFIEEYSHNGFDSFVATTRPHNLTPKIMLVAHVDVVPAAEGAFELQKIDGKYYGRGVLDMKFAAATFLQLIDDLKGKLDQYDLGIMITTDEELGGTDGVGYLVDTIGYRPEVCIIPDGGMNWEIETFAKGIYWIDLVAKGVAAHASRPWEGEHAVHKLVEALTAIRAAYPYTGNQRDTLLSVGAMTGGGAVNQLAEQAQATLDIRTGSLKDHQEIVQKITDIAAQYDVVTKARSATGVPCINDPKNPYIRLFHSLITAATGKEHDFSFSFAASDGRFFSAHDIPCIIVQPPGGSHHSDNEWLSIEGFEQFYKVLRSFVAANPDTNAVSR